MKRQARHVRQRRGTTLVLFAVLLFAILPMMALVLDLGIVRVTRRQMQTAANLAASEGLRHRDSTTDQRRREIASDTVQALFDDDLNPDNGDLVGYSAGPKSYLRDDPRTTLPGTSYRIGPRIDTDDNGLPRVTPFDPVLQTNHTENKIHGDLVSGELHSNYGLVATNFVELPDYSRPDQFDAKATTSTERPRAMLARLRRTRLANNDQAPDDETGVSSAGPPVPYVFGRGGLASGGTPDPNALWNQREAGVTVRATAIADARPALTVGPAIGANMFVNDLGQPLANAPQNGLAPFAVQVSLWESFPDSVVIDEDGNISRNGGMTSEGFVINNTTLGMPVGANDTTIGVSSTDGWLAYDPNSDPAKYFMIRIENEFLTVEDMTGSLWKVARGKNSTAAVSHSSGKRVVRSDTLQIGASMEPSIFRCQSDALREFVNSFPSEEIYVPIYEQVAGLGNRVVGFGWLDSPILSEVAMTLDLRLTSTVKIRPIAPQNATVVIRTLGSEWDTEAKVNDLFSKKNLLGLKDRLLLAPALIRTLSKLANSP